jgi:predicted amidophosphoribosyltransferase
MKKIQLRPLPDYSAKRFRETPVKFCRSCFTAMHNATKQCPNCGEPATEKGRQAWRDGR